MNSRAVVHGLGWTLGFFGLAMFLPVFLSIVGGQWSVAWDFGACAVLTSFIGFSAWLVTRGSLAGFGKRESFLFLVLIWPFLGLFGAMPLYLVDQSNSFLIPWFEAVSGITTTGASIWPDLDQLARPILFWRSMLQWIGGFVSLVCVFVLMSFLGTGGLTIFQNLLPAGESDNIAERALQTALFLAPVYTLLTALCAASLWAADVPAFDAVCLAFATLSTGGFVPTEAGLGSYKMGAGSVILAAFMIIGAINFSLHWALLQGRYKPFGRNRELRHLLFVALFAFLLLVFWLGSGHSALSMENLILSGFAVLSLITTTGFTLPETDALGLPSVLVIALVLIGGATGSTAGGIKPMRFFVLLKQAQRELARLSHPHAVVALKFGRRRIDDSVIGSVWSFFFVFLIAIAVFTVILSFLGVETVTAFAAVIVGLCNVGPALSLIAGEAATYRAMPEAVLIWISGIMILGRLELLVFFALLMPSYWRN